MKNQLLEDIDDSQSSVSPLPIRRLQRTPAAPARAPVSAAPAPAPPSGRSVRRHAGVWRSRPVAAPPNVHAPWPEPAQPQGVEQPQPQRAKVWKRPAAQAPHMAPPQSVAPPFAVNTSPEIASFSSREPDWSVPHQPEPAPWTERWGRKALGWTAGLAVAAALATVAVWMVRDTQVESTLAVVADHSAASPVATPAVNTSPAPAAAVAAESVPMPETASSEPPPLRMLPREAPAVAQAPVEAPNPTAAAPAAEPAAVPPPAAAPAPKPAASVARPAAKRPAERRSAEAPAKRSRLDAKKPVPKPARERMLARAPAAPVRPAPQPAAAPADPIDQFAETLRLCRAAGYHANACLKRGCEATRFGLVCRG